MIIVLCRCRLAATLVVVTIVKEMMIQQGIHPVVTIE